MLKQLINDRLRSILSDFIYFDESSYNFSGSVTSCQVLLENVRIKESAFAQLGLPIRVKSGVVGKLDLGIPFGHLYTRPVTVVLSDVYLVAGPVRSFDRKRAIAAMRKRKQDAIANAASTEAAMQQFEVEQGADAGKKDQSSSGVGLALGRGNRPMLMTIADNIQVNIANLHVRYEDDSSPSSDQHSAVGCTMEKLTVRTCDENWERVWHNIQRGQNGQVTAPSHRMVQCLSLAVYSNSKASGTERWDMDLSDELNRRILHSMIHRSRRDGKDTTVPLKHILEPTSVVIKAALGAFGLVEKKAGDSAEATPEADVVVESSEVSLVLDERQFSHVTSLAAYFQRFALWQRYKSRPVLPPPTSSPLASVEMARAHWRYALHCKLLDIRAEKAGTLSWMMRKRRVRQAYLVLAKHLRGKPWRPPIAAQALMKAELFPTPPPKKHARNNRAAARRGSVSNLLGPEPSSSHVFRGAPYGFSNRSAQAAATAQLQESFKSLALLEALLKEIDQGRGRACVLSMAANAYGAMGLTVAQSVDAVLRQCVGVGMVVESEPEGSAEGSSPRRRVLPSARGTAAPSDEAKDNGRLLRQLRLSSAGALRTSTVDGPLPGEALEAAVGALCWMSVREIEDETSMEELVLWRRMAELEITIEEIRMRAAFGGEEAYHARLAPRRPAWSSATGLFRLSRWPWPSSKRPPSIGRLHVRVESARGLRGADAGGTSSDPYVQLYLSGSDEAARTRTRTKTLSPEWGQEFELRVESASQLLHVLVMDEDTVSSDILGELLVPLESVMENPDRYADASRPLQLCPPPKKQPHTMAISAGSIRLSLRLVATPTDRDGSPNVDAFARRRSTHNRHASDATNARAKEAAREVWRQRKESTDELAERQLQEAIGAGTRSSNGSSDERGPLKRAGMALGGFGASLLSTLTDGNIDLAAPHSGRPHSPTLFNRFGRSHSPGHMGRSHSPDFGRLHSPPSRSQSPAFSARHGRSRSPRGGRSHSPEQRARSQSPVSMFRAPSLPSAKSGPGKRRAVPESTTLLSRRTGGGNGSPMRPKSARKPRRAGSATLNNLAMSAFSGTSAGVGSHAGGGVTNAARGLFLGKVAGTGSPDGRRGGGGGIAPLAQHQSDASPSDVRREAFPLTRLLRVHLCLADPVVVYLRDTAHHLEKAKNAPRRNSFRMAAATTDDGSPQPDSITGTIAKLVDSALAPRQSPLVASAIRMQEELRDAIASQHGSIIERSGLLSAPKKKNGPAGKPSQPASSASGGASRVAGRAERLGMRADANGRREALPPRRQERCMYRVDALLAKLVLRLEYALPPVNMPPLRGPPPKLRPRAPDGSYLSPIPLIEGHITAARVRLEMWRPPDGTSAPMQIRALAAILDAAIDGGGLRLRRAPVQLKGSEEGMLSSKKTVQHARRGRVPTNAPSRAFHALTRRVEGVATGVAHAGAGVAHAGVGVAQNAASAVGMGGDGRTSIATDGEMSDRTDATEPPLAAAAGGKAAASSGPAQPDALTRALLSAARARLPDLASKVEAMRAIMLNQMKQAARLAAAAANAPAQPKTIFKSPMLVRTAAAGAAPGDSSEPRHSRGGTSILESARPSHNSMAESSMRRFARFMRPTTAEQPAEDMPSSSRKGRRDEEEELQQQTLNLTFGEHLSDTQQSLYSSSRFDQHRVHAAGNELNPPPRSATGRTAAGPSGWPQPQELVETTLSHGLVLAEMAMRQREDLPPPPKRRPRGYTETAAAASSTPQRAVADWTGLMAGGGEQMEHPLIKASVHLCPVEGLVHLPFLMHLIDFFVNPLQAAGLVDLNEPNKREDLPKLPPDLERLALQVDITASQLELTLMNHAQGPNMPLVRLRVLDMYAGLSKGHRSPVRVDMQLPIEAHAYSAALQEFECLLEPAFLAARLLLIPAKERRTLLGDAIEVAPLGFKLWIGSAPLHLILTHSLVKVVATFLAALEQAHTEPGGKDANVNPMDLIIKDRDTTRTFLLSPYWLHNETGGAVGATISRADVDGAQGAELSISHGQVYRLPVSLMGPPRTTDAGHAGREAGGWGAGSSLAAPAGGSGGNREASKSESGGGGLVEELGAAVGAMASNLIGARAFGMPAPKADKTPRGGRDPAKRTDSRSLIRPRTVSLTSELWKGEVRGVRFDHVGRVVREMVAPLPGDPFHKARLACEVVMHKGGANKLVLDSLLHVRNETRFPLVVRWLEIDAETRLVESPDAPRELWQTDATLDPMSSKPMPLQLAHLEHFALRLNERGARWSFPIAMQAVYDGGGRVASTPALSSAGEQGNLFHGAAAAREANRRRSSSLSATGTAGRGGARHTVPTEEERMGKLHWVLSMETDASADGFAASSAVEAEEARLYDGTYRATRDATARLVLVIAPPFRLANMLPCPLEYRLFSRYNGLHRSGVLPREAEAHVHAFPPSQAVEVTPYLPGGYLCARPPVVPPREGRSGRSGGNQPATRIGSHGDGHAHGASVGLTRRRARAIGAKRWPEEAARHESIELRDPAGNVRYLWAEHCDADDGARRTVIYAQFWLLNKTALPLFVRAVTSLKKPDRLRTEVATRNQAVLAAALGPAHRSAPLDAPSGTAAGKAPAPAKRPPTPQPPWHKAESSSDSDSDEPVHLLDDDVPPEKTYSVRRRLPPLFSGGRRDNSIVTRKSIDEGTARLATFHPHAAAPDDPPEPMMMSFDSAGGLLGSLVAFQVADGKWSEFSISRSPMSSMVLRHEAVAYEVSAQVTRAPGPYARTRLVTLLPRFVLINTTSVDLLVGQGGHDAWFLLPRYRQHGAVQQVVWHWPSARLKRRMGLKLLDVDSTAWLSTAPFRIGGNTCMSGLVKCRHPTDGARTRMMGVHQKATDGTVFVKFCDAQAHEMPLMITNNTFTSIRIHQCQPGRTILGPAVTPAEAAAAGGTEAEAATNAAAASPSPPPKRARNVRFLRKRPSAEPGESWRAARVAVRRTKGSPDGKGSEAITNALYIRPPRPRRFGPPTRVEAAVTLQRVWRGTAARSFYARRLVAARYMQRVWRGALGRRAAAQERDSARVLQRVMRGALGRRAAAIERQEIEEAGALAAAGTHDPVRARRDAASVVSARRRRGYSRRANSQRDEVERRRNDVGSMYQEAEGAKSRRRGMLPSRKRRLTNWAEESVGVDTIAPGQTLSFAWDFPEGSLRLEIRGQCLKNEWGAPAEDWWTSITTSRPFTVRQIGGASDVIISLTDIAGPLKLLEVAGGMSIPRLRPKPCNVPRWLRPKPPSRPTSAGGLAGAGSAGRLPRRTTAELLRGSLTATVRGLLRCGHLVRYGARRTVRAIEVEAMAARSVMQGYLAPPEALPLILLQASQGSQPRAIIQFEMVCALERLHVSLVNGLPQELLQLALHGLHLHFKQDLASMLQPVIEVRLAIGHLQIDNQLHRASLPVVLAPTSAAIRPGERLRRWMATTAEPTVVVECRFNQMVGVDSFQHLTVRLAPLSLMLEESLLFELVDFANPLLDALVLVRGHPRGVGTELPPRPHGRGAHAPHLWEWPLLAPRPAPALDRQVVVDVCYISAIAIDVKLRATGQAAGTGRARALLAALLTIFGNIDHFPLRMRPHTMRRHLSSWDEFSQRLAMHYALAAAPSALTLLFSLNIAGGVPELLASALIGIYRALFEPVRVGLLPGPDGGAAALLEALRDGWTDLARKVVLLPSLFVYRVSSAVSELLALLTLSPIYIQRHTRGIYASEVPISASDGLEDGVGLLVAGIVGLTGCISKPYRGALHKGPVGFAKGLIQGILCLLKPPIGVFDLLTKSCEGLTNSSILGSRRHVRQQQPFALHADRLVTPFNEQEARAYALLSLCSSSTITGRTEFFQHAHPIELRSGNHIERRVVLVTTRRVAYGRLDPLQLIFEVPLERMARVELHEPYTHIIVWTWTEIKVLSDVGTSAVPNVVMERHIHGSRPSQLRAAKDHLLLLANQEDNANPRRA